MAATGPHTHIEYRCPEVDAADGGGFVVDGLFHVHNTFLDSYTTQGGLLPEPERAELLAPRSGRRAKTWFAQISVDEHDDEEDQSSTSAGSSCHHPSPHRDKPSASSGHLPVAEGPPEQEQPAHIDPSETAWPASYAEVQPILVPETEALKPVLSLKDSLGAAGLRSVPVHRDDVTANSCGVPSIGSLGHHLRDCKPCAFLDSRMGCIAGFNCAYCHLCERGEKKRRQKETRKMMANLRRLQKQAAPPSLQLATPDEPLFVHCSSAHL